jgi:hypothetical protein
LNNYTHPGIFASIDQRFEPSHGREEAKLKERIIANALVEAESS